MKMQTRLISTISQRSSAWTTTFRSWGSKTFKQSTAYWCRRPVSHSHETGTSKTSTMPDQMRFWVSATSSNKLSWLSSATFWWRTWWDSRSRRWGAFSLALWLLLDFIIKSSSFHRRKLALQTRGIVTTALRGRMRRSHLRQLTSWAQNCSGLFRISKFSFFLAKIASEFSAHTWSASNRFLHRQQQRWRSSPAFGCSREALQSVGHLHNRFSQLDVLYEVLFKIPRRNGFRVLSINTTRADWQDFSDWANHRQHCTEDVAQASIFHIRRSRSTDVVPVRLHIPRQGQREATVQASWQLN